MTSLADRGRRSVTGIAQQSTALVGRAAASATDALAVPGARALATARTFTSPIQAQSAPVPVDGVEAANRLLRQLGITTFTPTVGLSTDLTFPVAVGGAVAGPYTPGIGNLTIANVSVNAVRGGEILYGFLPVGVFADFGDKSGVHVAWFNVTTLRGGLGAPLGGLTDTVIDAVSKRVKSAPIPPVMYAGTVSRLKRALRVIPSNGVRGGLVDTGQGVVVCAVYGTVRRGRTSYFFLPSIGVTRA
ncbi:MULTISPECIES: hypothetical protein [Gordonia]|uniref:hypothetical protein n=1 Tax=Gordonia TaxID=2053 RepID=UPI0005868EAE|nr:MULTISPECIES: hypothetical protein [Gordonia]KJR05671.1 hypothetical protein UG54_15810 [Gordonia sihwensis]KXT57925.1 hypothetical protein Y710_04945 [Gordonia sp. QH-12]